MVRTLTIQLSDLDEKDIKEVIALVRGLINAGIKVEITGDEQVAVQIQKIIDEKKYKVPEWLQEFHKRLTDRKKWSEEPLIKFYKHFWVTSVSEILDVLKSDEKFERLKNLDGVWKTTTLKIITDIMASEEYQKESFGDDGKELSEIYPNLRIQLPSREQILRQGSLAFPYSLRIKMIWWWHKQILDIYHSLFIRWVQIRNTENS